MVIVPLPGRNHTRATAPFRRPVVSTSGAFLMVVGGFGTFSHILRYGGRARWRAVGGSARCADDSDPCTPSASSASGDQGGSSAASLAPTCALRRSAWS